MLPSPRLLDYGNTVIHLPYKVLFKLKNFNSTADIKDTSGNNLTVTNAASLPVGSNAYGTYIDLNGTQNAWFSCKNQILDIGTNCEVYYKISGITYQGVKNYGATLLDTRPINANGKYIVVLISTNINAPMYFTVDVNNTGAILSTLKLPADPTVPIEIRIRFTSTGTQIFVNDVLYIDSPQVLNVVNQTFTVGRNAFFGYGETQFLSAKVYEFEIRQLL